MTLNFIEKYRYGRNYLWKYYTCGVTVGNQNSVLNSNLDLNHGKLSDKVSIRASLQDSNIPLQDGGYSQQLDQFDNIFIEIFSDRWDIRAAMTSF
jgi:hypothetical protein